MRRHMSAQLGATGLRRRDLLAGASAATSVAALSPGPTSALPRDVDYAIQRLVGGVSSRPGLVQLEVPTHSDTGTSVPMTVGMPDAPAGPDMPRAIHVLVDGNPRPNVVSAWFAPDCGRAALSTRIRLESAQVVTAIAQMPDGQVWRADQEVTVNFGACANVGTGTDSEIRDFKPVSRVVVPRSARLGEVIAIRTLISHPMETGLRLNQFNTWIPLRIVEEFTCSFDGQEIIRIRPYPAIATNPYFAFHDRVRGRGMYEFRWFDTDGSVYANSATIDLA